MEKREFICIGCPIGCELTVEIEAGKIEVSGNECNIGNRYAKEEIKNPKRNISLALETKINGETKILSVKTKTEIPKNLIFQVVKEIKKLKIDYPVHVGDIVIKNILDTGSDIVAISSNL